MNLSNETGCRDCPVTPSALRENPQGCWKLAIASWRNMLAPLTDCSKNLPDPDLHVHLFIGYRPTQQINQMGQWLKGISSRMLLQEFPDLSKQFWGRDVWARGYLAVSSGRITDEMVQQYIEEQEGEPILDDSRFPIDES